MKIAVLDIGGTHIKSGLWTPEEGLSKTKEWDTQAKAGGRRIIENAKRALSYYKDFDAIGISSAGQIDVTTGKVIYANSNLPDYTGIPLRQLFKDAFQCPVAVENDVNAAALGEAHFGAAAAKENKEFLCLAYGTGIGGALIINGEIYRGSSFSAGEFGSLITHGSQRVPDDYMSGTYERYASVTALVAEAVRYNPQLTSGRLIFQHIDDPGVKTLVDSWIDQVILGIVSLVSILNPSLVVLGGGIMNQKYIVSQINSRAYKLMMPSFREVQIVKAEHGNDAGMLGAAYLAKQLLI